MLNFCDLPFEESCLEFHKTERNVRTPSSGKSDAYLLNRTGAGKHTNRGWDRSRPRSAQLGVSRVSADSAY